MAEDVIPPFSVRNRGAHAQIDNDFPETARTGLFYLLRRLVEKNYVAEWKEVHIELQRIGRVKPEEFDNTSPQELLFALRWDKILDFCERIHSHLAQEASHYNRQTEEWELDAPRSEVQKYVADELQRLFLEEYLAFEFSNGRVRRRGRRHTADQVSRAELVLGEPRLSAARAHFNKALRYFGNVAQPDYENVVKEAVCATEATARVLFPEGGPTLGDVVKSITGSEIGELPKPIAKTFDGLYGFRNAGEGVGHGGATGGAVTKELAEYALAVSASQIILLVDLAAAAEPEVPF